MKSQLKRVLAWLLMTPFLFMVYVSIHELRDQVALANTSNVSYAYAHVIAIHKFRGPTARYEFQVIKDGQWFSATDAIGRKNLWAAISYRDWNSVNNGAKTIKIKYLITNPSVNRPADVAGIPVADSIVGLILFVVVFIVWVMLGIKIIEHRVTTHYKPADSKTGSRLSAKGILGTENDTRMQLSGQNKPRAKIPATFIVCQIAGVIFLVPVLVYIWGGALRETVMLLFPYLADPLWAWSELIVGVLLLGAGASVLFVRIRRRETVPSTSR